MADTLLYDEKCNFCKVAADLFLTWDGDRGALRSASIQSDEGQALLHAVPAESRLDSFHLVAEDGTVTSAGPALARLFGRLPGGAVPAKALAAAPGVTSKGYDWVATNRITLSRFVPGAVKRRASRRVTEREARMREA